MSDTLMAAEGQIKTYRGASIEELLPQIRAELGPDAVVLSRREGLIGGFAGFFQKRCIEVDARAGGPRIDVYDEGEAEGTPEAPLNVPPSFEADGLGATSTTPVFEPLPIAEPTVANPIRNDAATREGLATSAVQELVGQAAPFADLLGQMTTAPRPPPPRGCLRSARPPRPPPQRPPRSRRMRPATPSRSRSASPRSARA